MCLPWPTLSTALFSPFSLSLFVFVRLLHHPDSGFIFNMLLVAGILRYDMSLKADLWRRLYVMFTLFAERDAMIVYVWSESLGKVVLGARKKKRGDISPTPPQTSRSRNQHPATGS